MPPTHSPEFLYNDTLGILHVKRGGDDSIARMPFEAWAKQVGPDFAEFVSYLRSVPHVWVKYGG